MATIEPLHLPLPAFAADPWNAIAAALREWAGRRGVLLRDAVLLLPFAQLLVPARRAFANGGGWMPRIATTHTLARSLGPPAPTAPHEIAFDPVLDRLRATQMLLGQSSGPGWQRHDPAGFRRAVGAIVETAQALARAAAAQPPAQRDAFWRHARDVLAPVAGPGATERWLARIALEWAAAMAAPATDNLYTLRPGAWIALQAGGPDPLTLQLLQHAAAGGGVCAVIEMDVDPAAPFAGLDPGLQPPALACCDGFEAEAQAAAAQVLAHVRDGCTPVALIAQDRELVRRIRALLERSKVALLDETGWKLSTTRAAARVRRMLDAAAHDATTDALIDWLKTAPQLSHSVDALEAACRRHQITHVAGLDGAALDAAAAKALVHAQSVLARLHSPQRLAPADWLARLEAALRAASALDALQADAAGRQVLRAIWLDAPVPEALHAAHAAAMTLADFSTWLADLFEQRSFIPEAGRDAVPEVVVTPLARAMLRPFAALVMPGADERHLGAPPAAMALLSDAEARSLGLPDGAARRRAELFAFAHIVRVPRSTFLRRRLDAGQPLATSPLVERLGQALAQHGARFADWADPRRAIDVPLTPVRRSAPGAAALLPQRLSASGCEALRACPYRFFATQLLRLREDDELDGEIEKREYGLWLHDVLRAFHADRAQPGTAADEIARLFELGEASRLRHGLDAAEFLPFWSSFTSFAPRYVDWLHRRDAGGARWRAGETEIEIHPPQLEGTALYGVIDRIDAVTIAGRPGIELIDYKTGSVQGLKDKVREPLEDTQLAFYAALVDAGDATPLRATYLALDATRGLESIAHPNVAASAGMLVEGLAHDLRRLRGGAALPALGEGVTCTYCSARGICRRDHWSADAVPSSAAPA